MKNILILLVLMASTLFVGCTEPIDGVVVVQDRGESSLDLL